MAPTDENAATRFLIVDDDEMCRAMLERLLAKLGFDQVRSESDARATRAAVARFDPDVVLLDMHLGTTTGLDILSLLARHDSRRRDRAVIIVTGDPSPSVARLALKMGADGVLIKPFDEAALRLQIERICAAEPHSRGA